MIEFLLCYDQKQIFYIHFHKLIIQNHIISLSTCLIMDDNLLKYSRALNLDAKFHIFLTVI